MTNLNYEEWRNPGKKLSFLIYVNWVKTVENQDKTVSMQIINPIQVTIYKNPLVPKSNA